MKYLAEQNSFEKCKQVVWGGGEPTLDKTFEQVVSTINKTVSPEVYQSLYKFCEYLDALKNFIDQGLIKITTSVDAGTPETFLKVRGRPKFLNVFENLKLYSRVIPNHVTVKYIFTDENSNEEELDAFIEKCIEYDLSKCCYQISMNFKDEEIPVQNLKKISYLFGKLVQKGINKVFLDYHIMQRLTLISDSELKEIEKYLKLKNIEQVVNYKPNNVIVYGSGFIAKEMINKSNFFKRLKDYDVVDTDKEESVKQLMRELLNHQKQ